MRSFVAVVLLLTAVSVGPVSADDWLRFRGPNGAGVYQGPDIPSEWSTKKNLVWKLKMPGKGFSSPIVVGDKVIVTCYTGSPDNQLVRQLVCVDRHMGKALWTRDVPAALPEFRSAGRTGYHGYASSTPVSDGERIYVHFGTTGVLAFDLDGKQLWQKGVGRENNSKFGSGSSPILWRDLIIVTAGNESGSFLAFDKVTGKDAWKAPAESLTSSYATPIIGTAANGDDEMLYPVPGEVWSLNPKTGKLNWYADSPATGGVCSSLVAEGDITYVVGGGGFGRPGAAAFRLGGKKDVTSSNRLWTKSVGSYVPSPVLYKGHLYWVNDRGSAVCMDAKTGQEIKSRSLSASFYASAQVINGKLIAFSRFDGAYVLEASTELTEIAHNSLDDNSDFSASPAVSNGQMFVRSDDYLYCIAGSQRRD